MSPERPQDLPSSPDRRRSCLGCAILPVIFVLALKHTAWEDIKLLLARRAGQPEPDTQDEPPRIP